MVVLPIGLNCEFHNTQPKGNTKMDENLLEVFADFASVSTAKSAAIDTTLDALIATLCKTFPPMKEVLRENLTGLANYKLDGMEEDQIPTYRNNIEEKLKILDLL